MSSRERWTIYPLLFLSLAISIRDEIAPPKRRKMTIEELTCDDLRIRGADGAPVMELSAEAGGGKLLLLSSTSETRAVAALSAGTYGGRLDLLSNDGRPQVQMECTKDGNGAGRMFNKAGASITFPVIVAGPQLIRVPDGQVPPEQGGAAPPAAEESQAPDAPRPPEGDVPAEPTEPGGESAPAEPPSQSP